MTTHNPVTNPKHYDLFPGQQSIDVIQAALTPEEFAGFCKGNALKYRLRAGEKGDAAEDLAKANWYRDRLWSQAVPHCQFCGAIGNHSECPVCAHRNSTVCSGNENPPTTSQATSATESPGSGLAKG